MKLKVNDVILFTFLLPNLVFPLFFPPLKSVIGNNRKEEGEMRKRGGRRVPHTIAHRLTDICNIPAVCTPWVCSADST